MNLLRVSLETKNLSAEKQRGLFLLTGSLHVGSRCDIAVDRTVDVFKIFDALTDQNQHLTVYASSFIIGNVGELV